MTAQFVDLSDETMSSLPVVIIFVLGLSFPYLLVVFRSLLIPAKAVVMNLLATFAAFGSTTWVFADGHLEDLFNFTSVGYLQVYLPIITFALLFLSMDYEVFLISRMHEQWDTTLTTTMRWPRAWPGPLARSPRPPSSPPFRPASRPS